MSTQMIIRIDAEVKHKLERLSKSQGKSTSQVVRELIAEYIKERDISIYIENLWNRTGMKLKAGGKNPVDIEKEIKKVRKGLK